MPRSSFIDFKAVKAAITMEQVLEHYALLDRFKKSGDSLSGPCPIHKGTNPTQFRISISKNIWHCFSKCKHGGNVLDFIAKMEAVTIHAAALKAVEWFGLDRDAISGKPEDDTEVESAAPKKEKVTPPKAAAKTALPAPEADGPNKPLAFKLEKLEREHRYLTERGLTLETIIDFGVGYCTKGMMAERVAIPIQNPEGKVVAYAGRFPGIPAGNVPKYKLPQGFRKSLELFNIDRAIREPAEKPLVIVEGFFDCMKIHQNGHKKVVALMGSSLSLAQEDLLKDHVAGTRIIIMLDEDEPGRSGREDVALRLAHFAFVKIHVFPSEGMQPDQLSVEEITEITGGSR